MKNRNRYYGSNTLKILMAMVFILCFLSSCKSVDPIGAGAQPTYDAINPSRIIAIPVFFLPHPAKTTQIDTPIAISEKLAPTLEQVVLSSFKDQPNVNGVSFSAVRNALGEAPNDWHAADKTLKQVAQKLISTDEAQRLSLPQNCLARKSFLDFYVRCLSTQTQWKETLNNFSAKVLNADAAMLPFVTEFFKEDKNSFSEIHISLAVVVVDTNNGQLIWGREATSASVTKPKEQTPTELLPLLQQMLNDDFWADFPGRRRKPIEELKMP